MLGFGSGIYCGLYLEILKLIDYISLSALLSSSALSRLSLQHHIDCILSSSQHI